MIYRNSCLLALLFVLFACSKEQGNDADFRSEKLLVSVESYAVSPKDDYAALDLRGLHGVDPAASKNALSGDPVSALMIGGQFDRLGKTTEARFWYQIAADNGSGVGMQRLSMMMSETNCRRAIFWLKRALSTDEITGRARDDSEKDMRRYLQNCQGS